MGAVTTMNSADAARDGTLVVEVKGKHAYVELSAPMSTIILDAGGVRHLRDELTRCIKQLQRTGHGEPPRERVQLKRGAGSHE